MRFPYTDLPGEKVWEGLICECEVPMPGGSISADRITPLVRSIRSECAFCWDDLRSTFFELAMNPRTAVYVLDSDTGWTKIATSIECGPDLRRVPWLVGIGCSGRRGRRYQVRSESGVPIDTCVLRRTDRPCHEVLGARIRFFRLVYAWCLR